MERVLLQPPGGAARAALAPLVRVRVGVRVELRARAALATLVRVRVGVRVGVRARVRVKGDD